MRSCWLSQVWPSFGNGQLFGASSGTAPSACTSSCAATVALGTKGKLDLDRLDVALAEATADERRAREELAAVLLAQFEPWTEAIRREWRECDEISAENLAALVESERRRGEVHAASRWLEDYVSAGFSGRLRRRGGGRVTPLFEERVHRRAVSGGRSLHRPSAMAGCNERRAGGSRRARGPKSR